MYDREKVMQWLKTCVGGCEEGCPYEYENLVYRVECKADLMKDALALLKEQETIVLCKDCKNAVVYDDNEVICAHIDSNGNDKHSIDWFCADGERR